jgi:hypothetical protein
MKQEKTKPARKLRSGSVSAAVWENTIEKDGKTITLQNITFQRSYRDKETGQWQNTDSFTPQSLGNLLILVLKAAMELYHTNEDTPEDEEPSPV